MLIILIIALILLWSSIKPRNGIGSIMMICGIGIMCYLAFQTPTIAPFSISSIRNDAGAGIERGPGFGFGNFNTFPGLWTRPGQWLRFVRGFGDMELQELPADQAHIFLDIFEIPAGQNGIVETNNKTDVHDHQIQESLRESVNRLKHWYHSLPESGRLNKSDTCKSIKDYLFNSWKVSLEQKEKAYSTIRQIEKTNGRLAAINRTEGEILQMVWQRICDPINSEEQNALKDNLLEQLSDSAIIIDASYCLVGRVTRMVQALQSLDKEGIVNIKSTDAITAEILAKVPVLRNEFFLQNPTLLKAYEDGDDLVAEKLVKFARDGLKCDYPNPDLEKLIDDNLEALY